MSADPPGGATVSAPSPGARTLYPAGDLISVTVRDVRVPTSTTNPGKRVPALPWGLLVQCRVTSSPLDGVPLDLAVGMLSGTIE